VWYDRRNATSDIFYRKHNGSEWEPEVNLVAWSGKSWTPHITAGPDDRLHVVWHDDKSGEYSPYYKQYDGLAWSAEEQLSLDSKKASSTVVAVDDSGCINVLWADYRDGNDEIYHKRFSGSSWGPNRRLTSAAMKSKRPSIAIEENGNMHLVWEDQRHGTAEIYYKFSQPHASAGVTFAPVRALAFGITAVLPNPVCRSAEIRFGLPTRVPAELSIFDVTGQLIWRHDLGRQDPGPHRVRWHCRDIFGRPVSPGVYFAHLDAAGRSSSSKIVVLR
jgi:hypothetical protein